MPAAFERRIQMIASIETTLDCLYGNAPVSESGAMTFLENGVLALLADRNAPPLRDLLLRQIASIERIKRDFLESTDLLRERRIPFLALKGILLGRLLYGDYAMRGFEDIDLAIEGAKYDDAVALFLSHGYVHRTGDYRDKSVEVFTCVRHRTTLEAHFSIATADRFGGFYLDLWDKPQEIEFEGRLFLIPRLEPYLIFLLIHLARHLDSPRAIWIEDIRRMLENFGADLDWSLIEDAARKHRLANSLSIAMRLCNGVFEKYQTGIGFPRDTLGRIEGMRSKHGRLLYSYLLERIESGEMTPFQRRLHSFGMSENLGDRLRMARDFLRIKFP